MSDYIDLPLSTQDLSGYAQLSGATFSGPIAATNLSGTNTGDESIPSSFVPSKSMFAYDDFTNYIQYYSSAYQASQPNSGSMAMGTGQSAGSIVLNTGTSANGGANIRQNHLFLGLGSITFECRVKINALDSLNDYISLNAGIHNNASYLAGDGCYFLYYGSADTTYWIASSSKFSGGRQGTDTVTSVAVQADTYAKLKLVITNNTECKYYINNTLVATNNTNMPPTTTPIGPAFSVRQNGSSTTNRFATIDYWWLRYDFTTPR
jgi:hypothetical protein